jgi:hypothetical protein
MDEIATEGFWKGMPAYTDAEVDLVCEFDEAVLRGENPDVEEWLARLPEYSDRLRPLLETSQWLTDEFKRMKEKYPGLRAWHFIGLPARVGEKVGPPSSSGQTPEPE